MKRWRFCEWADPDDVIEEVDESDFIEDGDIPCDWDIDEAIES